MKLKSSKSDLPCLEKQFKLLSLFRISFVLFAVAIAGCASSGPEKRKERPMIYEGMPTTELTEVIGEPDSIQSGGTVYNADINKSQVVKKWYYNTRTIVVIDDTVKTPQLIER